MTGEGTEYFRASDVPLRTALKAGSQGFILFPQSKRVWGIYRKWLPIPWRKWQAETWPVTVGNTTSEGSTFRVNFESRPTDG